MDHVLVPRNPAWDPPRIPYYCLEEYDRGDFSTYPERQGWIHEELFTRTELDNGRSRGQKATAAFLQQWLFFGLLHAMFGDDIKFQDYIDVDNDGTRYVHTRNLLENADQLRQKRDSGVILETDTPLLDRALSTANRAYGCVGAHTRAPLDPYFLLSLALLGQFLGRMRASLIGEGQLHTWTPPHARANIAEFPHLKSRSGYVSMLTYKMAKEGWCPRALSTIQGSFLLEYQYFAALLPNLQKDGKDHTGCTSTQCLASQIEKSTYQTAHTRAGCNCHFSGFDPTDLGMILQDGKLPLVAWDHGKPNLIAGQFDAKYVAISHVWSDGLGNPYGNSMPECQLKTLNDLVQNLYPNTAGVPFWIDTMCCPTRPPESRTIAIQKMRETYAGADKVLVLDNTLRSIDITGRSVREIGLYIVSSNWASRLWTLQEGALPDRVLFQFSNATFDAETIYSAIGSPGSDLMGGWGKSMDIFRIYAIIRGNANFLNVIGDSPLCNIGDWAEALGTRATSVREDEALCLASLMDVDVGAVLKVNRQDRMRQFWSQLKYISQDWMYFPGARIDSVGFRWAPRTLLGTAIDSTYPDENATITKAGLLVNAYSITFQDLNPPLSCSFADDLWIRGTDGEWTYCLTRRLQSSVPESNQGFGILQDGSYSHVAILMTEESSKMSSRGHTNAVMVFVTEERDGVTYARRGDSGNLFEVNHPSLEGTNFQRRLRSKREDLLALTANVLKEGENYLLDNEYAAVVGDCITERNRWCID
ncbi:Het domain protein [Lasiodiplodia theobromae]|uniref:Het domain protein n=1 Tax=Lasiodiplodia theobromae TaxID=45133 RepID=UPI0015C39623|nr:Het domain protein [Lasiodiplodia theobromae]KAF4543409.1 Het domain protein [Lasiodiplodia theobromae]